MLVNCAILIGRRTRNGGEGVPGSSSADHSVSPPIIDIPRDYNAAYDLIERNLAAGRAGKIAYIDDAGRYTYGELAERVDRAANALTGVGLGMESRDHGRPSRHDRFPQRVPGCDQGRDRADRRQHASHHRGLQVHAGGQPRTRAGGVGGAAAGLRTDPARGALARARDRVGQECARSPASASVDGAGRCHFLARTDHQRRRLLLALLVRIDRHARKARCTSTPA